MDQITSVDKNYIFISSKKPNECIYSMNDIQIIFSKHKNNDFRTKNASNSRKFKDLSYLNKDFPGLQFIHEIFSINFYVDI